MKFTRLAVLFSMTAASMAAAALANAGSVYEEAKKVCAARLADEQKSGSIPNGMSKSRYLTQCQNSYVRSVKLENELSEAANEDEKADSTDGQGGPEILPPTAKPATPPAAKVTVAPKVTVEKPSVVATKPVPRFKPTLP